MNRSILIVICDFIITSMIYLNGGFSAIESPFQDGGGATVDRSTVNMIIAGLESQRDELIRQRNELILQQQRQQDNGYEQAVDKLSRELADTRSKLEFMQRRARLNRENAGPLSPADLQKELEAEIKEKNLTQSRLEKLRTELDMAQKNIRRSDAMLAALQQQHKDTVQELANRSASLEKTQNSLSAARTQAAQLGERLSAREADLARQTRDLNSTRQALATSQSTAAGYRQKLTVTERDLAYLRGKANATEKELATTRDRLLASEKSAKSREIELASAQTQLSNMQNVVSNAVRDLANARAQLASERNRREDTQNKLTKLQGNYDTVSAKLQNAESKLRSDVLKCYTDAASKLQLRLREKRLLLDRSEASEYYLPQVSINGRNYLISTLSALTGSRKNSSALSDVVELNYTLSSPNAAANAPSQRLNGPILISRSDCRVALMEVPSGSAKPLEVLTKKELKERGIHDLYLFKVNSFGKDSTILDSRCSMSFESDDDYLYIRNGARVSSELKAEVGDLVLTKQGELAAVVVALEDYDFGRQQEARCFVFGSLPEVDKLPRIVLTKPAGATDYRDFCDKLNFWMEQAKPLDARKRRR
ncbi:MAG: hypothetical protein E7056_01635 [Lentisphaerae bacterium]|nr:hypothetical protein [Lentisphaerota bacterium]